MRTRNRQTDACPGVLSVHRAADGGVARVRVPGGQLTAAGFRAVADAAADLGDGGLELTSRANLQVRGLAEDAEHELADRLAAAGLLPSVTHERVRNITASPLTGRDGGQADVRPVVASLDRGLCASPELAGLPGRFLFAVDDGRGDVAWSGADVAALWIGPAEVAVLVAGVDVGLRVRPAEVVGALLAAARGFLAERGDEWRIAELAGGAERVARYVGSPVGSPLAPGSAVTVGPLGRVGSSVVAGVPLGRLDPATAAALTGDLVVTPWRSLVLDGPVPEGLLVDPADPLARVSACTGRPGCASALADVRADALLRPVSGGGLPVHWSGCERRCGRPRGAVDVVATGEGYQVRRP